MKKTDVVIIGTGPYGISIANELYHRNVDFMIIGKTFELWQEHTLDTMAIRSDWHTSEIYDPDHKYDFKEFLKKHYEDYDRILRDRIPVDIFRSYLDYVEENLPYDVIEGYVTKLSRKNNGFHVEVGHELITAKKVIVATGIGAHIHIPESIQALGDDHYIHTWHTNTCKDWKGQDILVIGNGQSAGETIVQLKEDNRLTWVRRKAPIFYSEPLNLPVPVFNFILKVSPYFYYLPRKIKEIFGKKYVIATITPDLEEGLMGEDVDRHFNDAMELNLEIREGKVYSQKLDKTFDQVIAATGYRYDVEHLTFIDERLRKKVRTIKGIPALNFDFLSSVPHLYFVGGISEPTYGPAQRFIMGSSHAAIRMGKVISR